ncbi:uncharacterized protein LOC143280474 [Babylonia areolata]|uniref:uncharacterized protein LOC143280474 n=1 Tax=Babylonia areolata TaxID=304850 RepID=UPI003FD022ED
MSENGLIMSKPHKKVRINTPSTKDPGKETAKTNGEELEKTTKNNGTETSATKDKVADTSATEEMGAETKRAKDKEFFELPVHIIPPGARFRGSPNREKTVAKPKPAVPDKKHAQPSRSRRHPSHQISRRAADDLLTSSRAEEVHPVSTGFALLSCPCCRDRNIENITQMVQRNYFGPAPQQHSRPVDYSHPVSQPYTELHLVLEIKRGQRQTDHSAEQKRVCVLNTVTKADVRYDEAMKKLAKSVENFSVSRSETETPAFKHGKNGPKRDLDL